jgi:hypothetical protein
MLTCVGVKRNGGPCKVKVIGEGQNLRCKIHQKTMELVGPNQIRRIELRYVHLGNVREIEKKFLGLFQQLQFAGPDYERAQAARNMHRREEDIRFRLNIHGLELTIERETALLGFNADHPYIERRRAARAARHAALMDRWRQRQMEREQIRAEVRHHLQQEGGELEQLVNDRQNIHTTVVVQKVRDNVEKILQIPVPPEYLESQKTLGEIITACDIPDSAVVQMTGKYCSQDDIYDLGHGIYRRVLNSVWQYIKTSPDSESLKRILRTEMIDNIGMCAQGNLSRICNILSGYIEGVDVGVKSKNETIGERLSLLLDVDDLDERTAAGRRVLEELNVPTEEHDIWLTPLIEA